MIHYHKQASLQIQKYILCFQPLNLIVNKSWFIHYVERVLMGRVVKTQTSAQQSLRESGHQQLGFLFQLTGFEGSDTKIHQHHTPFAILLLNVPINQSEHVCEFDCEPI